MEQRTFGRTGMHVPAITFGGGWVGGVLIHDGPEKGFTALDRGMAAGIDWIDTAAGYGNGVSEAVIGEWLSKQSQDGRPRISTKFRLDTDAGDFKGQMLRSLDESFVRLRMNHVPLVYLHNQLTDGPTGGGRLSADDVLRVREYMENLIEQRLCSAIGMTALGDPGALHKVVGTGHFDAAQIYYNMLNPTAWSPRSRWNSTNFDGLLRECAAQNMGVMGIRIFAGGHLASPVRHGREIPVTSASDDAAEEARARRVWQALRDEDGTPAQAALRFGLACPGLSTIVVGLGEIDHLEEAIAAVAKGPMEHARLAAFEAVLDAAEFTA